MMKELEHAEQKALIDWWEVACRYYGVPAECLFAIPNGGFRHISVAKKLKDEGVRSGVPDLFLACGRGSYKGLFIEMKKRDGGVVSDKQKKLMSILRLQGYAAHVCHGWNEAANLIKKYLTTNLRTQSDE